MASRAVTQSLGSLDTYRIGIDSYDADKLGLGKSMVQMTGGGAEDDYAGACPVAIGRPVETAVAVPCIFPRPLRWSNTATNKKNWVFLADNAAAAVTRRIVAYEHDLLTNLLTWKGFITLTYPAATAHTIRDLDVTYDLITTGTVGVSGTAVTGSGTSWLTNKACIGNRIGFGSTDPTAITTWYEISAIGSDTGITLTTTAGTITAGTAFVIEDLRVVTTTTNATTTNGGLFVAKGLRYENFSSVGTTIPAATTVDQIRAVYWLKDAAVVTSLVALGHTVEPKVSSTEQYAWILDTLANPVLFKFNIRAALTVASGAATNAFTFKTGSGGALTGTASQNANFIAATLAHGAGSGVRCGYFSTTTRIYRTVALSTITSLSTVWLSGGDVMTEVPPGGTVTFAATAAQNSLRYLSSIDKLLVLTSGAAGIRNYVTQYKTDASQYDRIWGVDNKQINQGSADATTTPFPNILALVPTGGDDDNGFTYIAGVGTTALTNLLYAFPLQADWEYAATSNQRLIMPRMATAEADKLTMAFAQTVKVLGGATNKNLGIDPEPSRMYYRTTGITDNSGAWTLVDSTGSLSGVAGDTHVQLMFEFRTIGQNCIPARILSCGVIYEDLSTDSHYQLSVVESDVATKKFAWRHNVAFGSTVPALMVRLYDAVSGALLVTDDTTTPTGTWERSTDGVSYVAWTNADKSTETTYVRYTPAALADGVQVRPLLTLA